MKYDVRSSLTPDAKLAAASQVATWLRRFFYLLLPFSLLLFSCEEEKVTANVTYNGPVSEIRDIELVFSDSARKMVVMKTPLQYELVTGDQVFPKEVNLSFYDKKGVETTTLRADSARKIRSQNLFRVMGNVRINNKIEETTLETDELFWNPDTRRIYTNRPGISRTKFGTTRFLNGFEAPQDLSRYSFGKVRDSEIRVNDLPD